MIVASLALSLVLIEKHLVMTPVFYMDKSVVECYGMMLFMQLYPDGT